MRAYLETDELLRETRENCERMGRRWRPGGAAVSVSPDDPLAGDWSPARFPVYARMCHELGLSVYPDGAPTRAWWRIAAAEVGS